MIAASASLPAHHAVRWRVAGTSRRCFVQVLALACAAHAPGLRAQPGARVVVGLLLSGTSSHDAPGPVREEFARLGWREGSNLTLEIRSTEDRSERRDELASELVRLNPALILSSSTENTLALKRLTDRIPIVVINGTSPVERGLAASLRRPGGNVTGLLTMGEDLRPKLLELGRAAAPQARRVSILLNALNPATPAAAAQFLGPARQFKMDVQPLYIREPAEIEPALRALVPGAEHVLVVQYDPMLSAQYRRIAALARDAKVVSISVNLQWAAAGGLLAYGPQARGNYARAVQLADQVLRGTPAGEIPFEQPALIQLIVNRRTAREIGVSLPQELLLRADEVIE